jgi:hypothetical protein
MTTITFYSVRPDPDDFQYFLFEDDRMLDDDRYAFDGRPKAKMWVPPAVVSFQPKLPEADFWSFGLGGTGATFAVRPEALRGPVVDHLKGVGELLPLPYKGREFGVVNITECIDALDADASTWLTYPETQEPFRVERPVFRLDRLGGTLFKVPETSFEAMYCWEDSKNAQDQFKGVVEREGLSGLVFERLYSAGL